MTMVGCGDPPFRYRSVSCIDAVRDSERLRKCNRPGCLARIMTRNVRNSIIPAFQRHRLALVGMSELIVRNTRGKEGWVFWFSGLFSCVASDAVSEWSLQPLVTSCLSHKDRYLIRIKTFYPESEHRNPILNKDTFRTLNESRNRS
jgi:hypothetical protein